jgi:hypothetical protein
METPTFLSSSGRISWAFLSPVTSQGLPMNTHGLSAASIRPKPSHGEAGEYRDPVLARI